MRLFYRSFSFPIMKTFFLFGLELTVMLKNNILRHLLGFRFFNFFHIGIVVFVPNTFRNFVYILFHHAIKSLLTKFWGNGSFCRRKQSFYSLSDQSVSCLSAVWTISPLFVISLFSHVSPIIGELLH